MFNDFVRCIPFFEKKGSISVENKAEKIINKNKIIGMKNINIESPNIRRPKLVNAIMLPMMKVNTDAIISTEPKVQVQTLSALKYGFITKAPQPVSILFISPICRSGLHNI